MKLFFSSLVCLSLVFPQNNQNIDGVAAIVEEHLVLKSDLAQMVNMSIIQNKINPSKDIEKVKALEKTILESMIDQKIILKKNPPFPVMTKIKMLAMEFASSQNPRAERREGRWRQIKAVIAWCKMSRVTSTTRSIGVIAAS